MTRVIETVGIPLHGMGDRIKAGDRLMLHVASADWPLLWPSPKPVTSALASGQRAARASSRRIGAPVVYTWAGTWAGQTATGTGLYLAARIKC